MNSYSQIPDSLTGQLVIVWTASLRFFLFLYTVKKTPQKKQFVNYLTHNLSRISTSIFLQSQCLKSIFKIPPETLGAFRLMSPNVYVSIFYIAMLVFV